MSVTVRGARINVVAVLKAHGVKFHLSRPVDKNGQRRRKGWMLSHEGRAMALLNDCDEAVAKAYFERSLAQFTDREWLMDAISRTGDFDTWRTA